MTGKEKVPDDFRCQKRVVLWGQHLCRGTFDLHVISASLPQDFKAERQAGTATHSSVKQGSVEQKNANCEDGLTLLDSCVPRLPRTWNFIARGPGNLWGVQF